MDSQKAGGLSGSASWPNIIMIGVFAYAVALPFPPYYEGQSAFASVLGSVPRMVIVSIIGYWVGSFTNAFVLARMKEWMVRWDPNHKFLALRTIASTIAGELCGFVYFYYRGIYWFTSHGMLFLLWYSFNGVVKCLVEFVNDSYYFDYL